MNVVARSALLAIGKRYPRSEVPPRTWYDQVSKATWARHADLKLASGNSANSIGDNRVIFDIGGNNYHLIVRVSHTYKACQVKFIGTHSEYDSVDPLTVEIR